MSIEKNKALLRRYVEEVLNKRNIDAVSKFFAANCVDHTAPLGTPPGISGIRQLLAATLEAFSDLYVTIEDMIAEEDKVVSRFKGRGTHTTEFMGVAPTGRKLTMMQINIDYIARGKIVEHWGLADQMALMQQLRVAPSTTR